MYRTAKIWLHIAGRSVGAFHCSEYRNIGFVREVDNPMTTRINTGRTDYPESALSIEATFVEIVIVANLSVKEQLAKGCIPADIGAARIARKEHCFQEIYGRTSRGGRTTWFVGQGSELRQSSQTDNLLWLVPSLSESDDKDVLR